MRFLDEAALARMEADAFQRATPYPWANPKGLLTETGYRALLSALPHTSLFEERFGETRRFGQRSHDRLALEYRPDLPLAEPWRAFIAELEGPVYREFLTRMLGTRRFELRFHWHYTPRGCSVSPHCDARRKLGSHIFYFNTPAEWDPAWGGETLILDDGGRFDRKSAPDFSDFPHAIASASLGNHSLLFRRRGNSWHGVRELRCPPGAYRKVFIVVIDTAPLRSMIHPRRWLSRPFGSRLSKQRARNKPAPPG